MIEPVVPYISILAQSILVLRSGDYMCIINVKGTSCSNFKGLPFSKGDIKRKITVQIQLRKSTYDFLSGSFSQTDSSLLEMSKSTNITQILKSFMSLKVEVI